MGKEGGGGTANLANLVPRSTLHTLRPLCALKIMRTQGISSPVNPHPYVRSSSCPPPSLSLSVPAVLPVSKSCSVAETRRKMEFAVNTRCKAENTAILEELVRLRHQAATLMGFETHADYQLAIRMAKSPSTVRCVLFLGGGN